MSFRLLLSLVLAGLHLYLWKRLVRDTGLRGRAFWLSTVAAVALAAFVPVSFFFARRFDGLAEVTSFSAYTWLGLSFYLFCFLVVGDLVRGLLWLVRLRSRTGEKAVAAVAPAAPVDLGAAAELAVAPREDRRTFIARSAATTALLATAGVGALGMRSAWDITSPEVAVKLSRLPSALDGYRIALLSDIHIGATLDGRFLRHLVEQTNRLRPDLIAVVGDLVDGSVAAIGSQVAELSRMRARDGVVFVTGNHEYYSGAPEWIAFLRSLGIRVLMSQRLTLGDRTGQGAQIDLAGVPDHHAGRHFLGGGADVLKAVAGRDEERELIVLAHQPVQIHDVIRSRPGLQLSGHTHGGQLAPFGVLTGLVQPYLAGLYDHGDSGTQIYVSRGSGFWGPPMRVLAPAEITHLHLTV